MVAKCSRKQTLNLTLNLNDDGAPDRPNPDQARAKFKYRDLQVQSPSGPECHAGNPVCYGTIHGTGAVKGRVPLPESVQVNQDAIELWWHENVRSGQMCVLSQKQFTIFC